MKKKRFLPVVRKNLTTTVSRLPAFRQHPDTNVECFFNNIIVASPYTLGENEYDQLIHFYGDADNFPINVRYGDGTPFSRDEIKSLTDAYSERTFEFSWEPGDILIADNMSTAHSRKPFVGSRKVLVRVNKLHDSIIGV